MSADVDRRLLAEFFLKMREEQTVSARHHENQRSSVTTIFASLAIAILTVISAVWQRDGLGASLLPLTLGLTVVGLVGLRIAVKLFERSMLHLSLAEAYIDSLHVLLREQSKTEFGGSVSAIRYVADATKELNAGKLDDGMFDIAFPGGDRTEGKVTPEMLREEISRHNPIDPRRLVVPRHNKAVVFMKGIPLFSANFAQVDLRRQWQWIYVAFVVIGVFMTVVVIISWAMLALGHVF
jgi:ABC-type uncharacterized transport system fused permease/ATPase subunit